MERSPAQEGRPLLFLALAVGLLAGCGQDEASDDDLGAVRAPEIVRIVPADEAIVGAHIPTLDPATMNDAQIRKMIGAGPRCEFRYTTAGRPVLAVGMDTRDEPHAAGVKVNGRLVALEPELSEPDNQALRWSFSAAPIRIVVRPDPGERGAGPDGVRRAEADMIFEVRRDLKVGYRGYLDCRSEPPMVSPSH